MILSNLKFLTATIIFTVLLMAGYYTTLERKTFVCLLTHRGGSFPQDVADAIKLLVKQRLCSNSIKGLGFFAGPWVKSKFLPQNASFSGYSSKSNYQRKALTLSSRHFSTQAGPGDKPGFLRGVVTKYRSVRDKRLNSFVQNEGFVQEKYLCIHFLCIICSWFCMTQDLHMVFLALLGAIISFFLVFCG
jgi:L-asparagine transporter-like permease